MAPVYATADVVKQYKNTQGTEEGSANDIEHKMKAGDRTICPKASSKDLSFCYKSYLKTLSIKFPTQLTKIVNAGIHAALKDKEVGYKGTTLLLMTIDNIVTAMERVNPHSFYVANLKPTSDRDKSEIENIKKVES